MKREKMLFLSVVWLLVLTNWRDFSKFLGWAIAIYGLPWHLAARRIRINERWIFILFSLLLLLLPVKTVNAQTPSPTIPTLGPPIPDPNSTKTPTLPVCTPVLASPTWIFTPLPIGTYGPQQTDTPTAPAPSMTPICINGVCSTQTMTPTPTKTPTPTITPTPGVGYWWELVIPPHELLAPRGTAAGEYWGTVYAFTARPYAQAVVWTFGKRCTNGGNHWAKGRSLPPGGGWTASGSEQGCGAYSQWWQAQNNNINYGAVNTQVNNKFPGIGGTGWWSNWGMTGFAFQLGYANGTTIEADYFAYTNGIWVLNYSQPPTVTPTPTQTGTPTPVPTAKSCNIIPDDNTGITLPTPGITECHLIIPAIEIDVQEFTIPLTQWSFPGIYFSTPAVQVCVTWTDLQIKLFGYDFTIILAMACAMIGVGEFFAVFRS